MPSTVGVALPLSTAAGGDRALTFTELDPTMLEAFKAENYLFDRGMIPFKNLSQGATSHDFSIFGSSPDEPEHHVKGSFISGGTLVNDKVNVALDRMLVKAVRIDWEDAEIPPWDAVAPAARECARLMARAINRRAFRLLVAAARTAAVTDVHSGGNVVERAGTTGLTNAYPVSSTGADNFQKDAASLAQLMDADNIPTAGRKLFIESYIRQVLTNSNRLVNRDYVDAGSNDLLNRVIGRLEGFEVIVVPDGSLPTVNVTSGPIGAGTDPLSKYQIDCSYNGAARAPAALAMHSSGGDGEYNQGVGPIGGVALGGMRNITYWDENRHCWLIKSTISIGMGKVSVWTAGEIGYAD